MACRSALSLPRMFAILAAILLICVLVQCKFARRPGGRKGEYNMNGKSPRVVRFQGYDYPRFDDFQLLNVTTACSEFCGGMLVFLRFYETFRAKITLLGGKNETLCQHEWNSKRTIFYVPFFGCGTTEEIVTYDNLKRELIYEYRNVVFLEERPPDKKDAENKQYYPHHNLPYKGVTRQIEVFCRIWESQRENIIEDLREFREDLFVAAHTKAKEVAKKKKEAAEAAKMMRMMTMGKNTDNASPDMMAMMMNAERQMTRPGGGSSAAQQASAEASRLPPQMMQYPSYTTRGREKQKPWMKPQMAPPQRMMAQPRVYGRPPTTPAPTTYAPSPGNNQRLYGDFRAHSKPKSNYWDFPTMPQGMVSHMSLMATQHKQQQALNASQLYNPYTRAPHQMTSTTANPYSYMNAYSMSGQAAVSLPVSNQPQGHRSKRAAGYPMMQQQPRMTTMSPEMMRMRMTTKKMPTPYITIPYKPYVKPVCTLFQKVTVSLARKSVGDECVAETQCGPRAHCDLDPYDGQRKCICGLGSFKRRFRQPLYEHDANDFGYLAYDHHGHHDRLFGARKLPDGHDRGTDVICVRACDGNQCKGNPCYTNLVSGAYLCLCGTDANGALDVRLSC